MVSIRRAGLDSPRRCPHSQAWQLRLGLSARMPYSILEIVVPNKLLHPFTYPTLGCILFTLSTTLNISRGFWLMSLFSQHPKIILIVNLVDLDLEPHPGDLKKS